MKYIVANWKAHFTISEADTWWKEFTSFDLTAISPETLTCILCPPFHLLESCKSDISYINWMHLGAQDISEFSSGTHTGEIPAELLEDLAEYVLVGHSERRIELHETIEEVETKYHQAIAHGITPLLFVQSHDEISISDAPFYVYEPASSISTGDGHGHAESLEDILEFKGKMDIPPSCRFLYGGSVNNENIGNYSLSSEIDGFVLGGISLDPLELYKALSILSQLD